MTEPKWWDCTLSREHSHKGGTLNPWSNCTTEEIGKYLMEHGAERCVVGEETGEDGYRHWQIRVVFKKETSELKVFNLLVGGHWTPTKVRDFNYVEKEGNFWRSWETALQCYGSAEFYPWQNEVINHIKAQG